MDPTTPPEYIDHDGYLVMYAPESDLDRLQAFHFCVKRTFTLVPDGLAQPARWQRPLYASDQYFEGAGPYEASMRAETDLGPPKKQTDVIVNATCYAPGGSATHCRPRVQIGNHARELIVMGDRYAVIRPGEQPVFAPAAKFSALPVRYEFAYGGVDRQHSLSPILCASNPLGTGYTVAPLEGEAPRDRWVLLPNIEDPTAMLSPNNLVVAAEQKQALRAPAGFGWVPRYWEPRAGKAGMPAGAKPLWKLLHGDRDLEGEHFREMQSEFWNGAAKGMAVPTLDGHEKITLRHLSRARDELVVLLPARKPKLRAAIDDAAMQAVKLSLDTVQIEVEANEVVLGWRGTLPAPERLASLDDLKRVLLEVDGEFTLPAPLIGTGFPLDLLTGEFPGPDVLDIKGIPKPGEEV